MKIDITQLLSFFDKLLPLTNEEEGSYWFETTRKDGLVITFAVSVYEDKIAISIYDSNETPIAGLHFNSCLEINILDENRKLMEILHGNRSGRCFLSLLGDPIFEYKD